MSAAMSSPPRGTASNAAPSLSSIASTAATAGSRESSARICAGSAPRDDKAHRIVVARAPRQLGRGRVGEHAALGNDDRPAAHRLDLLEQVGRDDDRLLRPHRRDDLAHLVLLVGVEPVGRLVEDQHLRVVQQCLRHPDAAPIALRERVDRLMQHLGDMDHLDHPADAELRLAPGKAADMSDKAEKLGGRHVGIGRRALGQVADSALRRDRLTGDVVAADGRGAGGGRDKAGDHLHRRRLAGPVRAEKAQDFAPRHIERNVINRDQRAEMFDQMTDLQHRRGPRMTVPFCHPPPVRAVRRKRAAMRSAVSRSNSRAPAMELAIGRHPLRGDQ